VLISECVWVVEVCSTNSLTQTSRFRRLTWKPLRLTTSRGYRWKASRARPRRRRDLKTVERAATDTTSVHHVVENTDETPDDDETVMDWLRTIDADALEDVVNDLLAEHATTILDPDRSRIVIIISSITPITDRISPIHAKSVR